MISYPDTVVEALGVKDAMTSNKNLRDIFFIPKKVSERTGKN